MATNIRSLLISGMYLQSGNGNPTHISPIASFFLDVDTPAGYISKGNGDWFSLSTSTSSGSTGFDVYVTGGTYSSGTAIFTNNTGGTFSVSGFSTGSSGGTDTYMTGFTYNNNQFNIINNTGGTLSILVNTMSGLTVNGTLSGVTILGTTISATTYNNLPLDIRVTGGTYSNGTAIFTNNTGGTFNVTGLFTGGTDVRVTGGTYSNGTAIFMNNTGGTFSVSGFLTGITSIDTYVTGGTPNNAAKNYTFTNNTGGTFTVNGLLDISTTAFTYSDNQFNIINNTGGTLSVLVNTMTGLTINGTLSATTYAGAPNDNCYYRKTGTTTFERWYTQSINSVALTTITIAQNFLRYFPMIIAKKTTLAKIGITITGAGTAGSRMNLGLYDSNIHLMPNNLLVDATVGNLISGDSATFQSRTLSIPLILEPGLYYYAINSNSAAAPTLRAITLPSCPTVLGTDNTGSATLDVYVGLSSAYATTLATTAPTPTFCTSSLPVAIFQYFSA